MASHDRYGIMAFLMHGECKALREGFRTRDNHLLEWFARLSCQPVLAVSRAEPWPRLTLARRHAVTAVPPNVVFLSPEPRTLPNPQSRRSWWLRSLRYAALPVISAPAITWNPIVALDDRFLAAVKASAKPLLFDLLDDWLVHPAFTQLQDEVQRAYTRLAEVATFVTANSEGTLARAHSLGRTDALLIPNGCDPDIFRLPPRASGPITVGYAGKLSRRLDTRLVAAAALANPQVRFVLAGPLMDRRVRQELRHLANVTFTGDIPYPDYPALLATFDIAWVPHLVGDGEIGGDVIKTYEYRAAGLPTLTTPLIGSYRAPSGTTVLPPELLLQELARWLDKANPETRIPRQPPDLPPEMTWRYKAQVMFDLLTAK